MTLEIPSCPEDTISKIEFNHSSTRLAVSSWDSRVKIYDVAENRLISDYCHIGPVLDCCWIDDQQIVSVGADKKIYLFDTNEAGSQPLIIGSHSDTIKCVAFDQRNKFLLTASWDKSVSFWKESNDSTHSWKLAKQILLEEKPHALAISATDSKIVVACDNRTIYILSGSSDDFLASVHIMQQRESSLKHPTRNVCIFSDGTSWCTSSTEGRVSVDYFDVEQNVSMRYAFKCHRQTIDGIEYVYPVNALAVFPRWASFATGGSDGQVHIWNRDGKRKLKTFPSFPTTISQLAFSPDGNYLAVAASYVFDQGEKDNSTHSVFVYPVYESDVNPALKSTSKTE